MNTNYKPAGIWYLAFVLFLLSASCDQSTKSDAAFESTDSMSIDEIDTMSVKKMGTDSNSDMPVQTPQDSTVKIPNAYEPEKK